MTHVVSTEECMTAAVLHGAVENVAEHDRLDKMLDSSEYTGRACGSLNAKTGLPVFCGENCPTRVTLGKG
jgi:hypothetical protein